MRNFILLSIICISTIFNGCGPDETTESVVYELPSFSDNDISGKLTINKNADGTASFYVKLNGTIKGFNYPTHLHFGDLSTPDAAVAALLNPTSGDSGISETNVSLLSDDTNISYDDIINGVFSLKIHLGNNLEDKNVILAGSNIGTAFDEDGLSTIAICGTKKN